MERNKIYEEEGEGSKKMKGGGGRGGSIVTNWFNTCNLGVSFFKKEK